MYNILMTNVYTNDKSCIQILSISVLFGLYIHSAVTDAVLRIRPTIGYLEKKKQKKTKKGKR